MRIASQTNGPHAFGVLPLIAAAVLAGCQPDADEAPQPSPSRPSIFLLTLDTLRADHLSLYGYARPTTPFLESLGAGSAVFDQAYSTSSWTVPALASLITGLYPASHGVEHGAIAKPRKGVPKSQLWGQEVIPETLVTLAEVLQKAGYRTYGVVANTHADPEFGFARGFDRYACVGGSFTADRVNAVLFEWQEEIEAQRGPVFLWLHYFDPHVPYRQRAPWHADYLGEAPGEPRGDAWQAADLNEDRYRTPEARATIPAIVAAYDSEIRYWDETLRALYAGMPQLADWFTVFSADHGEEFLEHGRFQHSGNLYNETTRVPLFVLDPSQREAMRSDTPVSWVDIPPTLVSVAQGEVPAGWQGVSLVDRDGRVASDANGREYVLAFLDRAGQRQIALMGTRWKLLVSPAGAELYDLRDDPGEKRNVIAEQPEQAAQLRNRLKQLMSRIPRPRSAPVTRTLTEEQKERLRSLGYIKDD